MKRVLWALLILLPAMLILGCGNSEDEVQEAGISFDKKFDKNWYGTVMGFNFRVVMESGGEVFNWPSIPSRHLANPFYTDIVFVHNKAEAEGFPDNVIVAWPEEGWAQSAIDRIHWTIENPLLDSEGRLVANHAVTLERFGLTYPLTLTDLVDNWEMVFEMWHYFLPNEQSYIMYGDMTGRPIAGEEKGTVYEED